LLAGIAAVLFFLKTHHLLGTLVFGMACFTLLRLIS
jgi:branched-subunit amino acid transport protein